jgi:SagB-type dehydrogenase family enzyme
MEDLHTLTNHSYKSIRMNAFFLDWRTQPKNYKTYPHFHQRFKIDDYEELKNLNLIGGITYEKEYPEGTYYLRTNPSAGALYPCEIYLQIRGIKGLLEGIYHYEPHSKSLVLLHELTDDGIEYYYYNDKTKQKGLIFLISSIYFRSSWKYRDRSLRYIFLDSGHQLGSIYASSYIMDNDNVIYFDFDKIALNKQFGFRDDEMFTVSSFSTTAKDKEVKPLKLELPYVCGCDYTQTNKFIEDGYKQTAIFDDDSINELNFFEYIGKEELKTAILNRRSIRVFNKLNITKDEFEFIVNKIFDFANKYNLEIYYTLHKVTGMEQGLYKEDSLLFTGDFSQKSRYLSLEQNLGGDSAVTFYFTSIDEEKYQKVNILSGFIAQIIYLKCELKNIGCSGIGAYYDEEVQDFLKTDNNILYLLAIGR